MSPNSQGLKQRLTDILCKCCRVPNQFLPFTLIHLWNLVIPLSFILYRCWTIAFARSAIGDTSPKGSNIDLTIKSMPRLVSGRSATLTMNFVLSSFTSQLIPKALSLCSASKGLKLITDGALSDSGMAQRTPCCY